MGKIKNGATLFRDTILILGTVPENRGQLVTLLESRIPKQLDFKSTTQNLQTCL